MTTFKLSQSGSRRSLKCIAEDLRNLRYGDVTTFVRAIHQAQGGGRRAIDGDTLMTACGLIVNDKVDGAAGAVSAPTAGKPVAGKGSGAAALAFLARPDLL